MSIPGTGDMSTVAPEQQNCKSDAEWEDANCYNWTGSKELLQGLDNVAWRLWIIMHHLFPTKNWLEALSIAALTYSIFFVKLTRYTLMLFFMPSYVC